MTLTTQKVCEVREGGLVGCFVTNDTAPCPGVLVLGGSEGGTPTHAARLLANEGFACLALRYFGAEGLPRNLVEVPLEYVEAAIAWMAADPAFRSGRIGVLGSSKGAELALLAASVFPTSIGAVVAYAPSSVSFAGIAFGGDGRRRSSWSYQGSPVPFVPYPPRGRPSLGLRGLSLVRMYRSALDDTEAVADAAIPIERTDAPILVVVGERDRMWPSALMADMLAARLVDAGKRDQITSLRFADAGHSFVPWQPAIRSRFLARLIDGVRLGGFGGLFDLGGRPKANRDAQRTAWPQAVAFFEKCIT